MDKHELVNQAAEQARLDHVLAEITQQKSKLSGDIARVKSEEKHLNEHFYDDVRLNYGDASATMETALSIRQQQQLLQERNNTWQHSTHELATLQRLEQKPYFARVDFHEQGEPKAETIYIGLGSLSDRDDNFLIYDWRAPISSIYYDGKLGEVTYESPDGPQKVDLTLKRQFIIEQAKIKAMFDTQETIGDQMLLEVLNEKSSTQMKSIVTTIQREQNKIIRDTKSDLLFVQGAAGSGKTSAILQRVAYLLYRYRGNLTSDQVIMFSPNQLFNDYIENVLPELGEHNMVQMTYWQFLSRRIPGLSVQNLFQQFEETQTNQQSNLEKLKNDVLFFRATKRYASHLEKAGVQFKDIFFKNQTEPYFSKEQIKEIYYSFNENYHLRNRIESTKEALLKLLNQRVDAETRKPWVQDLIEHMSAEELRELYDRPDQEFESSAKETGFLARKIVLQQLKTVSRKIHHNQFLNIRGQYVHFLKRVPQLIELSEFGLTETDWADSIEQLKNDFRQRQVKMADASAYLYLYDLVTGRRGETSMRYVFIDEIQDYTPFQLAYLKYNFPRAKFTMLGDLNQAILIKEDSSSLLSEISGLFDEEKTKVVQLTTSYRSTAQVTNYTKEILSSGQQIEAFDRVGPLPVVYGRKNVTELIQVVATMLQKPENEKVATAIITKTLEEAQQVFELLKANGLKTTLIGSQNQRLVPGAIVVPAYLAKGLEFDAVIMWDASSKNYQGDFERQLVYTIASRAMHTLTILYQGEFSPLLAHISPDLYEVR